MVSKLIWSLLSWEINLLFISTKSKNYSLPNLKTFFRVDGGLRMINVIMECTVVQLIEEAHPNSQALGHFLASSSPV